jgi:hypothetical protein
MGVFVPGAIGGSYTCWSHTLAWDPKSAYLFRLRFPCRPVSLMSESCHRAAKHALVMLVVVIAAIMQDAAHCTAMQTAADRYSKAQSIAAGTSTMARQHSPGRHERLSSEWIRDFAQPAASPSICGTRRKLYRKQRTLNSLSCCSGKAVEWRLPTIRRRESDRA